MEHVSLALTSWRGSKVSEDKVRDEIKKRWGEKVANEYDARFSARTLAAWHRIGYMVKKGEHGIPSVSVIEEKDGKGNVIKTHMRRCYLFHLLQVKPVYQ